MRKGLLMIMAAMVMCACGVTKTYTYYQVFKATPVDESNMETVDNGMMYEDENCIISYVFWAENGNAGLAIYNKTDRVLCIDMNKSFFIRNKEAFNYYPEMVSEEGVTYRQMVAIPPLSYRSIITQAIWNDLFVDCDLDRFPASSASLTFNAENSPVHFGNYLTYNFGEGTPENVIKNDFYVSSVTNYASPAIVDYLLRKEKPCVNKTNEEKKDYSPKYSVRVYDQVILINTADCFYVPYEIDSSRKLYKDGGAKMTYDDYYQGYIIKNESGWE